MKMKQAWLACLASLAFAPAAMSAQVALVGGTLVDGTLSDSIKDSVILIEGERIVAVGTVGSLAVPEGAEVISTEGMQ